MQASICVLLVLQLVAGIVSSLHPVVLVPGNGGNQIDGRVTDQWRATKNCTAAKGWHRLWLNVWQLLPSRVACWNEQMMLQYDPSRQESSNMPGVETRVPGFGNTSTVEVIDPSTTAWMLGNAGAYFSAIAKEFVNIGYDRGKSLRGAPYDFRYAPHSQQEYFKKLKEMIEIMYKENKHKRVILLAHSAGGLFSAYFLNQQAQSWKSKYIERLITLGTPWAGSSIVLQAFTSGFNFNVPILLPLEARKQQRTSETNMLLMPKQSAFDADKAFVITPTKNYSLSSIAELFNDIAYEHGIDKFNRMLKSDYEFTHIGVDIHCWFGTNVSTPDVYVYKDMKKFPNANPEEIINTDGDETVPRKSLEHCKSFKLYTDLVDIKTYPGQSHNGLLFNRRMIKDLIKLVNT